jgi:hypothetical protein
MCLQWTSKERIRFVITYRELSNVLLGAVILVSVLDISSSTTKVKSETIRSFKMMFGSWRIESEKPSEAICPGYKAPQF